MLTRRPRRLPGVSYVGYQRYFLTICTARRIRAFADVDAADLAIAQLRRTAAQQSFALLAYCFMPDHAHVATYATSVDSNLEVFATRFKQSTGYAYRRLRRERLWQPGYYERLLRDDESTEAVVRYVLENPIRAGLARKIGEYPFAGSDLYDTSQLIPLWQDRSRQD